ncbi:hypothetical protein WDU94_012395 [Cyamophila willieti]
MSLSSGIPPLKLSGITGAQQYEAWKVVKFQFENYILAANLHDAAEDRKVALLLHVLGVEVVPIFQTFNVDKNKDKLDDVVKKFEAYFAPKKNLALERNKLLSRKQQHGESLESYMTELKNLSNSCELGSVKDSLIKDLFILGLREENQLIRERLLQEGDKTLEKVLDLARTMEMSYMSRNKVSESEVMKIHRRPASGGFKPQSYVKSQANVKCGRCGQTHRTTCPAANAVCHNCSIKGHYAVMCRNKSRQNKHIKVVHEQEVTNEFFIGAVNSSESGGSWTVMAEMNKNLIDVCLDTGAEANLLSYDKFKSLGFQDKSLKPTSSTLTSYGGTIIPTKGQCILYCNINNLNLPLRFFITEASQKTILGLEACQKYNLIKKIGSVSENTFGSYQELVNSYEEIFEGLGCLPGQCHITLRENANPHIDPPRRVPFKLMSLYKEELQRMEKMKVITKVTEPTLWLNSVVLVSKPDSSLRVCLDPKPLNNEIIRARYPLPTIEEVRSKMSKMDMRLLLDYLMLGC